MPNKPLETYDGIYWYGSYNKVQKHVEKLTEGIQEAIQQLENDLYFADETDTVELLAKLKALMKE